MKIKETIVVEGRDDTCAVKAAVDAETIETHGFGIRASVWNQIEDAYNRCGIIVFTDPDHAGGEIRRRLIKRFPDAKEAFLDRDDASKDGDVGIENASPEAIQRALSKVCTPADKKETSEFQSSDMVYYGLTGTPDSADMRKEAGRILGIGYGNAKAFLRKLNHYGISRPELESAIAEILKK